MATETDYSSQKFKELRAAEIKAQILLDKFIEDIYITSSEKFRLRRMVSDLVRASCRVAAS